MTARRPVLFVDADACPVTRIAIACARRYGLHCVIAGNTTQNLERSIRSTDPREEPARGGFWIETLPVGVGADAADFAIVTLLKSGDVVVTQDIGLAAMVLGKNAFAIGVRGRVYTLATIDMDLEIRHEEKKLRRAGKRTGGPAAFTEDDSNRFASSLARLVDAALAGHLPDEGHDPAEHLPDGGCDSAEHGTSRS